MCDIKIFPICRNTVGYSYQCILHEINTFFNKYLTLFNIQFHITVQDNNIYHFNQVIKPYLLHYFINIVFISDIFVCLFFPFREIEGKTYVGAVKEKEKAKKQYDKAVSSGQTAGLVK